MKLATYSDVICPFCGCLCDDIEITVENNKVVKTRNSCAISNSKFMKNDWGRIISPTIDGKPTPYEKAIEEATNILSSAKRPLIYGLSKTDNEAIREAV